MVGGDPRGALGQGMAQLCWDELAVPAGSLQPPGPPEITGAETPERLYTFGVGSPLPPCTRRGQQ